MKKLLGILVLGLLWCNVGVASDWIIFKESNGSMESYNIKSAKEYGPLQFKVLISRSDTKDKIKYKQTVLKKLYDYCDKKDGIYPTPKELHIYGKPEFEDFGIQVSGNGNRIEYATPYKRYLYPHEYSDTSKFRGYIFATCYLSEGGFLLKVPEPGVIPKNAVPREKTMRRWINHAAISYYEINYLDCNREMVGVIVEEAMIKNRKKLQKRFEETTEVEKIIWKKYYDPFRLAKVCKKLIE